LYDFALRPRWLAVHAVLLTVVGLFAVAGLWQIDRLSERRERNTFVLERRRLPVADFAGFDDPEAAVHRRVRASGRYDVGREVILRGRGNEGRPGNHVLTPLVMSGGRALIVDRGWVPPELDSPPVSDAMPPRGRVDVTGLALPSEGSGPLAAERSDRRPEQAVARIDLARIGRSLPYRTHPVYLVAQRQLPPQPDDLPDPVTLAELAEGSHLIYAIQWFLFIPIALVGYGAILRREEHKLKPNR
jgi:cytochrome oxidase assembly protein ShyY1